MKTFLPKIDVQRRTWRIVDADGLVLGRVAEKIANIATSPFTRRARQLWRSALLDACFTIL